MGQHQSSALPPAPDPNPTDTTLHPQRRATRRSRPRQPRRGPRYEDEPDPIDPSGLTDQPPPTSPDDLRAVRTILSRLGLPAELIFQIMDEAEYYPAVQGTFPGPGLPPVTRLDASGDCPKHRHCAARLCMLSPPVPGGASGETWRAKKVVWTLESHDQGWGGEHPGTFHAAYSWFEACIVRPVASDGDSKSTDAAALDSPESLDDLFMKKLCKVEEARPHLDMLGYTMVPRPGVQEGERDNSAWLVQRNLSAKREFTRYRIEWRAGETLDPAEVEATGRGTGEGFLQSLQPGDRVGLWMRALFPGWANVVKHASVEVFYDVY